MTDDRIIAEWDISDVACHHHDTVAKHVVQRTWELQLKEKLLSYTASFKVLGGFNYKDILVTG